MSTKPEPNDPFGIIRGSQLSRSTKKSRLNPRVILIAIGGIIIVGLIIGALIHKPSKTENKKSTSSQAQTQDKSSQSSTKTDTKSSESKSPSTSNSSSESSNKTSQTPVVATPAEDAAAIGGVLQSTYSAGAPASANTCNKTLSGYSYSIDDQQAATARATVVTQSSAGGNTINVALAKNGTNWAISSVSCR